MKNYFQATIVLLLLLVAGCAANGPRYNNDVNASTEKENLYIYRPYAFLSGALSADVYVDGNYKGTLKNGGFLKLNVSEGGHSIRVGKSSVNYSLSDNKSFFRYTYGWALFFSIPIVPETLEAADKDIAIGELKETSLSI